MMQMYYAAVTVAEIHAVMCYVPESCQPQPAQIAGTSQRLGLRWRHKIWSKTDPKVSISRCSSEERETSESEAVAEQ